ncbi:MAG: PAS domain S-box protein [Deltaproteobacteria bacterium]|nr:PAS domain S-box protein [Deltaproteobacteria bacterium]
MKKKILVIDNSRVILKYMTRLLGKEGHQVKTAEDGLSALDILMTYIPDVMFIDLVMPNINGEQLCRIIRKMPALKDTYAVILSATIAEKSWDFTELGANAFIAKGPLNQMAKHVLAAIEQSDHHIPMGDPKEIMGSKDVHKREITKELRSAEKHLETIINNISDGIIELGAGGRVIFANPAAVSLMGLSEESLLGLKFTKLINEDDRKRIEDSLLKIEEGSQKIDLNIPIQVNSRQILLSMLSVKKDVGSSFILLMNDITERKRAEEVLRESEAKYRSMMEGMSDSVYICSSRFRVAYMNPSMIKMIGRDATGERCHRALYDKDEHCLWCQHEKVQQGESAETEIVNPKNNRSYTINHSPLFHEDGSVSKMTIYRDITETKQLQDKLFRSERLLATGQLAATIAHEINSPLQGITSLLNSIGRTHKQDERLLEKLYLLKSGFTSIRDTVKQLLDLNRPGKENKQAININRVIEDTIGLLKSHLKKNGVNIILNLSSKMPNITASPQQLGQVFMNLISNAVEAMAGTSKSKDEWKIRESADREITVNSNFENNNILIKIADNGPGILKEDMEHIFDPFYTRKKEMGMGIGLSLCHGIIEDHNGSIAAKNFPGGGAIFTITLPVR